MTTATRSRPRDITAPDGTRIHVEITGDGPPLVAVHGTTSDHASFRFVTPLLAPHLTVCAVDRRGRGGSGDAADYTLGAEQDDIAAVVDTVAEWTGGPVHLLGHSYGGNVAFGAALRTDHLASLTLYEGWPVPRVEHRTTPPEVLARMEGFLADGDRERALLMFCREVAQMSEDEVQALRAAPTWPARLAAIPTAPREIRAFGSAAFDPDEAARIQVPVLLLVGSESTPEVQADPDVVAAALPDARVAEIEGAGHVAQLTHPEAFADRLLAFVRRPG